MINIPRPPTDRLEADDIPLDQAFGIRVLRCQDDGQHLARYLQRGYRFLQEAGRFTVVRGLLCRSPSAISVEPTQTRFLAYGNPRLVTQIVNQ